MLGLASIGGAAIAAGEPSSRSLGYTLQEASGSFAVAGQSLAIGSVSGYLNRKNWLGFQDFLGSSAASQIISWAEVNIGQPNGFGGVIWGGWQKFTPGNYQGQFAQFRYFVQSPTSQVIGELLQASALCSVPNRIDNYLNVNVPTNGLTIAFTPSNSTTPQPFNKGPSTAAHPAGEPLPAVQVTFNNQPGDQLVISALNLASVTLQILNGGAGVARTLASVMVQGF